MDAVGRPEPLRPLGRAGSLPVITPEVPGSFPWGVLHERHPRLIRQVQQAHPYQPRQLDALEALYREITDGTIGRLSDVAADRAMWDGWAAGYLGRPWDTPPFLWAESYFYRKLLDATEFFGDGAWRWIDPFEPVKAAELGNVQAPAPDQLAELGPDELTMALMLGAVWGNQADLGYRITAGDGGPGERHVIHDDRAETLTWLQSRPAGRITVIADNGGSEIAADLILTDHLLRTGIATDVALHVKPYPYFVSDATTTDVLACLRQLGADPAPAVADRLRRALNEGRLTIQTHPFYCHPYSFHYLPGDLARRLATANLVIAKGDLNYRRLVGDLEWPPTDSFDAATAYFPAPVLSLRILKSDVITGLTAERVAELDRTDPSWRTNSNYAVAQASLSARAD